MRVDWRREWPHWLLLAMTFGLGALAWNRAPEQIPVHWNLRGEVDAYGGRFEGLFALPLIALAVYVLMLVLPRLDPRRESYAAFERPYQAIRLAVLGVVFATYLVIHAWMWGVRLPVEVVVPVTVGVLFVVLGIYLPRVRPNWFVGIRTPWTLSSDAVWEETHRVGGPVMAAAGLLIAASGFLPAPWNVTLLMAAALGSALGLVAYSYVAWRRLHGSGAPHS